MLQLALVSTLSISLGAPAEEPPVAGEQVTADLIGPILIEDFSAVRHRHRHAPDPPRVNGRSFPAGTWTVPSAGAMSGVHSGVRSLTNRYGDDRMGVGLPAGTDVLGAWFAGQSATGAWAEAVRVIGERDGATVATTDWLSITAEPQRLAIDFENVDRIVVEARRQATGGAWWALDDLELVIDGEARTLTFEDLPTRTTLSGTDWGGLNWEFGTGTTSAALTVPPPVDADSITDARRPDEVPPAEATAPVGPAQAPVLVTDFTAVIRGDAGQFSFPPDTCGAVGPEHFVATVNRNWAVYDKNSGAELANTSLTSFQPGTNGDPRVIWDHLAGRWIVVSTDFDTNIYFAYSLTADPFGPWLKTPITISAGLDQNRWPDYPTLGFDNDGIYVSAYMIGGPNRMTLLAIDKAPLLADPPAMGNVTAFRELPVVGAIQPCISWEDEGGAYTISRWSSTSLRIRQVTGSLASSPTLTNVGFALIPSHLSPPDAPALGSGSPLDTVGSRLMNAVQRGGSIWTAHAINVDGRAAARWYKVDTQSLAVEYGTISDPVRHYYFPSVAVNGFGDMAMGFSGSHANEYAGSYFAGRRAGDPAGSTSLPQLLRNGTAPQNNIDGFGRNRWGDYSLTTVDPTDDATFYTIQEHALTTNVWATHVGRLEHDPVTSPDNDVCAEALVLNDGATEISNEGAGADGPLEPGCFSGGGVIDRDVWYRYSASCTGQLTINLCDTTFDARLSVYAETCPEGESSDPIACAESGCPEGPGSIIELDCALGEQFLIRVGGTNGDFGAATIRLTCEAEKVDGCEGDIDASGVVDFEDLLAVLTNWGPCPPEPCVADINGNGFVDLNDLIGVLGDWGPCPG